MKYLVADALIQMPAVSLLLVANMQDLLASVTARRRWRAVRKRLLYRALLEDLQWQVANGSVTLGDQTPSLRPTR
jgi:hypothetical protein